jgi:hypothetical protein
MVKGGKSKSGAGKGKQGESAQQKAAARAKAIELMRKEEEEERRAAREEKEKAKASLSNAETEQVELKPMCIRCPTRRDAEDKHHENNFEKCYQDYPTRPNNSNNAASNPLIATEELWWDFSRTESGVPTNNADLLSSFRLDSADACKDFLDHAKGVGKRNFPSKGDELAKKDEKEQALQRNKQEATYDISTNVLYAKPTPKLITKEILEATLRAVRSVSNIEKAVKTMKDHGVTVKKRSDWDTALALMKIEDEASLQRSATQQEQKDPQSSDEQLKPPAESTADTSVSSVAAEQTTLEDHIRSQQTNLLYEADQQNQWQHDSFEQDSLENDQNRAPKTEAPGSNKRPPICYRCPEVSPYTAFHAASEKVLLECFDHLKSDKRQLSVASAFWPELPTNDKGLSESERQRLEIFYTKIRSTEHHQAEFRLAKEIVDTLQIGSTSFEDTRLTKLVAEESLRATRLARPADRDLKNSHLQSKATHLEPQADHRPISDKATPVGKVHDVRNANGFPVVL